MEANHRTCEFIVNLEDLGQAEEDALTRMGKTNTENLLKKALKNWFGKTTLFNQLNRN